MTKRTIPAIRKRVTPTAKRTAQLRAALEARRRQLTDDMNSRIRDVRSRSLHDRDMADAQDGPAGDTQDDLDLALIQMKAETLGRIEAALKRLDAGVYGNCVECSGEISSERLRAMPFAVRCTTCEDAREKRAGGTGDPLARRSSYSSFDV